MEKYTKGDYTVRKFEESEWQELKAIRLEALQEYPDRLNQPYQEALSLPDEYWVKLLRNPQRTTFAILHLDEIIGYHFVRKESEQNIARSCGSYIRRQHNWRGIDPLLYSSAIDWAKEQGCASFQASCKEDNYASLRLFKKYGAELVGKDKQGEPYGDGKLAKSVHYTLKL